jgi:hypothetical protein
VKAQVGDFVQLYRRSDGVRSDYDGLEWEVIQEGMYGTYTLRLVGGTQTCGCTEAAIKSIYRKAV